MLLSISCCTFSYYYIYNHIEVHVLELPKVNGNCKSSCLHRYKMQRRNPKSRGNRVGKTYLTHTNNMSNRDKIHPHPDNTTYTWGVIVKPARGSVINGFWMAHICDSQTQDIASVNANGVTLLGNNSIYSYSGHDDGWTMFYMDSNNDIWVCTDYQAGINSGSYNAPDYNGTLTLTVDPTTNSVQFDFAYMDGSQPGNKTYNLNNFVLYSALS